MAEAAVATAAMGREERGGEAAGGRLGRALGRRGACGGRRQRAGRARRRGVPAADAARGGW